MPTADVYELIGLDPDSEAAERWRSQMRFLDRSISEALGGASFWERDWSTAGAARASYAEAAGCRPEDLLVEGPDGGPYLIAFRALSPQ